MTDPSESQSRSGESTSLGGMSWSVLIGVVLLAAVFWLVMTRSAPEPARHPAVGRVAPDLDLVRLIPVQPAGDAEAQDDAEAPDDAEAQDAGTEAEDAEAAAGTPPTLSGPPSPGTVTLLHFWGTWCPPCRIEYPELVEMVRQMDGEPGFRFITVSCGTGGAEDYDSLQAETAQYYETIGASELETYADLSGQTRQSLSERLDTSVVYPTTVMISPGGRIAGVWLGYSPAGVGEMRQVAEELLEQIE